jgi:hypothetical protein
MRSISRVADVSINTVTKLLVDAGEACLAMHDELVRDVKASKVQCDEIWSFTSAKQENVEEAEPSVTRMSGKSSPPNFKMRDYRRSSTRDSAPKTCLVSPPQSPRPESPA